MYRNLEAEMARNALTKRELAKKMKISNVTLSKKLHKKTDWTWTEILKIKKILEFEMTVEKLFETTEV